MEKQVRDFRLHFDGHAVDFIGRVYVALCCVDELGQSSFLARELRMPHIAEQIMIWHLSEVLSGRGRSRRAFLSKRVTFVEARRPLQ